MSDSHFARYLAHRTGLLAAEARKMAATATDGGPFEDYAGYLEDHASDLEHAAKLTDENAASERESRERQRHLDAKAA